VYLDECDAGGEYLELCGAGGAYVDDAGGVYEDKWGGGVYGGIYTEE
jgi:hypothetical protein